MDKWGMVMHGRVVTYMRAWDGMGISEKGEQIWWRSELLAMGMKRGKWVCMTG